MPRLKAEFFKTLGHPVRIRVLELLSESDRSVAGLLEHVGVEQPALSQQLAVLRRSGLVISRRAGGGAVYSLVDERVTDLLAVSREILLEMATAAHDELGVS